MTAPSIVVPGATIALCRRTNFRKAFLAPWCDEVNKAWLYCLALGQHRTSVAIHQTTLAVNHHHTDVTACEPNLPEFAPILHGEFRKAVNVLMARERYDRVRPLVRTPRDVLNLRGDRVRSAPRPEVRDGKRGDQRGGVA